MRGSGVKNIVAENLSAVNLLLNVKQQMNNALKMCWKCQKSKSSVGGHIKTYPGLMKFICKDCMDARAEAKLKENT
jgi:hypothetical protein